MSRTKREAARERAERVRREMEDRVLAGAARLRADDHSLEAEQVRQTAASIAEHREMAARRREWDAAET